MLKSKKDQRQSLRELYWNHNHSSWRNWRSPDEEKGTDEKRQDYPGGLGEMVVKAQWRQEQRAQSSWWEQRQARKTVVSQIGNRQLTGTGAETGSDLRRWHSDEKNWCVLKLHLDFLFFFFPTSYLKSSWTSVSGYLGLWKSALRVVSPGNTVGFKISWTHRPSKREGWGPKNTSELSQKY